MFIKKDLGLDIVQILDNQSKNETIWCQKF